MDHHHYLSPAAIHQASIGFADSSSSNFSSFRIPARIQGAEEHACPLLPLILTIDANIKKSTAPNFSLGFEIEFASERLADMGSQLRREFKMSLDFRCFDFNDLICYVNEENLGCKIFWFSNPSF
ncbi:hypothetical protein PIB30_011081 [Stylosanthes scabra]|uniref:Uncharacterized protein n=1 Tax=Stylosanthes scabra TaxID=79078 RepID=A0ABU6Y7F2_9FABA|nr:hypothetical protein [Stylosanthes scabra]